MNIILDNIAIWQPKLGDDLTVRALPAGAPIQQPTTNIIKKSEATIYRYAKNYKTKGKSGVRFCLFVRTYLNDEKKIEKALDAYAAELTTSDVTAAVAGSDAKHFTYTNHYLEVE